MKKIKLMSHLIAGYPDKETALIAARSLVKGGADILEIQLPFSDPSADGPAIQTACTKVLENGYKIRVKETMHESVGVDLLKHIQLVEEQLKNEQ